MHVTLRGAGGALGHMFLHIALPFALNVVRFPGHEMLLAFFEPPESALPALPESGGAAAIGSKEVR